MSSTTSSLLRTKNQGKLVKRLLQRSADWHAAPKVENEKANTKSKKGKKRKHNQMIPPGDHKPASEEEIIQRHIATLLEGDSTMRRPPTKSMKRNPHKKSNAEVALNRVEKQDRQASKQREKAKTAVQGSSRSTAVQSQVVHEPTFNKKRHEKAKKEAEHQRIAKLLQKQAAKWNKQKQRLLQDKEEEE